MLKEQSCKSSEVLPFDEIDITVKYNLDKVPKPDARVKSSDRSRPGEDELCIVIKYMW